MLICHCRAVNDETIRTVILSGARRPADIAERCGAGASCGGCLPALLRLLDEAATADPPSRRSRHSAA